MTGSIFTFLLSACCRSFHESRGAGALQETAGSVAPIRGQGGRLLVYMTSSAGKRAGTAGTAYR